MVDWQVRSLYGGKASILLPVDYFDASRIRQIPNHQEVFLDPKSQTSLVIEIVEIPTLDNDREDGVQFYAEDLVVDSPDQPIFSERRHFQIKDKDRMKMESIEINLQKDCIKIELVLLRILNIADVLITLNLKGQEQALDISALKVANDFHITDWSLFSK